MSKTKYRILIILLVIILPIAITANYFGPRLIIQTKGGVISLLKSSNQVRLNTPADFNLNSDDLVIKTNDGLDLKGYVIYSNKTIQKGTIIMVHGIRSCKEYFLPMAKVLADSCYNVVLIDLRAHGQSEGEYCTFGYHEKEDLSIVVDTLLNNEKLTDNIGIWGQSLGAAVSLQAMSVKPEIKFGIIESTFSDFETIVHDYIPNFIGFDIPLLTDYFIYRSGRIADFSPSDVKPFVSAQNVYQPILMVHGTKDDRIKIDYGRKNFEHLASDDKEFLEIPDANHLNVWRVGGVPYVTKIFGFLDANKKE
ncbi:alpha/beta hydrolase [Carboxylicivirga caseinilyticus]|uniref:alpha/beta hydrolase n=1 Tax=Carboxylicivirga caseinilyticus TaxID=3417572 RepID=UPI003D32CD3E|nr:alpha/beta fold hydrolase [Marinilabiliaceae bacterium A049]